MRKGQVKNIDTLIPMFTVEMHMRKLTLSQQAFMNKNCKTLFGCTRKTLWDIRYHPAPTEDDFRSGNFDWSPLFSTVLKIADHFGLPIDAMINRTRQKIVAGEQLRIIDPDKTGATQLEIKTVTLKKKKATA